MSFEDYTRDRHFSISKFLSYKKVDETNAFSFNLSAHKIVYDYFKNGIPLRSMKVCGYQTFAPPSDDAKRILRNLWRYLEQKRNELRS